MLIILFILLFPIISSAAVDEDVRPYRPCNLTRNNLERLAQNESVVVGSKTIVELLGSPQELSGFLKSHKKISFLKPLSKNVLRTENGTYELKYGFGRRNRFYFRITPPHLTDLPQELIKHIVSFDWEVGKILRSCSQLLSQVLSSNFDGYSPLPPYRCPIQIAGELETKGIGESICSSNGNNLVFILHGNSWYQDDTSRGLFHLDTLKYSINALIEPRLGHLYFKRAGKNFLIQSNPWIEIGNAPPRSDVLLLDCNSMQTREEKMFRPDLYRSLISLRDPTILFSWEQVANDDNDLLISITKTSLVSGRILSFNCNLGRSKYGFNLQSLDQEEKKIYATSSNVLIWDDHMPMRKELLLYAINLENNTIEELLRLPEQNVRDHQNRNTIFDVQEKDNLLLIQTSMSFLVFDKIFKSIAHELNCIVVDPDYIMRGCFYPEQKMLIKDNKFYFPTPDFQNIKIFKFPRFNLFKSIGLPSHLSEPQENGRSLDCFLFSPDQQFLFFELQQHIGIIDTNIDELVEMIPITALGAQENESSLIRQLLISEDNKKIFAISPSSIFMAEIKLS